MTEAPAMHHTDRGFPAHEAGLLLPAQSHDNPAGGNANRNQSALALPPGSCSALMLAVAWTYSRQHLAGGGWELSPAPGHLQSDHLAHPLASFTALVGCEGNSGVLGKCAQKKLAAVMT